MDDETDTAVRVLHRTLSTLESSGLSNELLILTMAATIMTRLLREPADHRAVLRENISKNIAA